MVIIIIVANKGLKTISYVKSDHHVSISECQHFRVSSLYWIEQIDLQQKTGSLWKQKLMSQMNTHHSITHFTNYKKIVFFSSERVTAELNFVSIFVCTCAGVHVCAGALIASLIESILSHSGSSDIRNSRECTYIKSQLNFHRSRKTRITTSFQWTG